LILGGDIHVICFYFNLFIAKDVPIDIAAGRAGGTVIVIMSKNPKAI